MLLGMESVKSNLEKETLSLFHNVWSNKDSPVFKINQMIVDEDIEGDYWIWRVEEILREIGFPTVKSLMRLPAPTKQQWKNLVKTRVREREESRWREEMSNKVSQKLIFPGDYKLDGKVNIMIDGGKNPREISAIRTNVKLLIGELETQCNLQRTGRAEEGWCLYCESNDVYVKDDEIHILFNCPLLSEKSSIVALKDDILRFVEKHCVAGTRQLIERNPSAFTLLIANPGSYQVTHLWTAGIGRDTLTEFIRLSQCYIQAVWNQRKGLRKQYGAKDRKSRNNGEINTPHLHSNDRGNIKFLIENMIKKVRSDVPKVIEDGTGKEGGNQGELMLSILGTKSILFAAQLLHADGRRLCWRNGINRISKAQGYCQLILFISDKRDVLDTFTMATSCYILKSDALRVHNLAPLRLSNPKDRFVDEFVEEYVPLTLVSSNHRGKLEMSVLRETREVLELFVHDAHDRYGPSTIHDRL